MMVKANSLFKIFLILLFCLNQFVYCTQAPNKPSIPVDLERSHLFNKSIVGDEGWRWRRSPNFTLDNQAIKSTFIDPKYNGPVVDIVEPEVIHKKLEEIANEIFFSRKIEKIGKSPIVFYKKVREYDGQERIFLQNTSYQTNGEASFADEDQFYIDQFSKLEENDRQSVTIFPDTLYGVKIADDNTIEVRHGKNVILKSAQITLKNQEATIYRKVPSANVACMAITIVFRDNTAYSKLLQEEGKTIIALAGRAQEPEINCLENTYKVATSFCLEDINNLLETNIHNDIRDAEAKLIYKLLESNNPKNNTLRSNIDELLSISGSKYDDIRLIVLHLHTGMDSCAICSKIFVGLSRQMNSTATKSSDYIKKLLDNIFPEEIKKENLGLPIQLRSNLRSGHCRFLIEVSSSRHYSPTSGKCAHSECSGRDANYDRNVNVLTKEAAIRNGTVCKLAIPNGLNNSNKPRDKNWKFLDSFPPYVVFVRLGNDLNTCKSKDQTQQHNIIDEQQNSQVTPLLNVVHPAEDISLTRPLSQE